jgi:hydroxymethylbilane synthase
MRIGTRRSALALAQARLVAGLLGGDCELVPMSTSGDREAGAVGDKGRWVGELERALLEGEIDLAVHSAKDVPASQLEGLALLGAPARAPAEDVLCGAGSLRELPAGALIGTSSLRRAAQLRAAREDVEVVSLRGNVDTRLRRLGEGAGGLAAIVLARAGLERLGLKPAPCASLDAERFVPAPGQGILALQGRASDADAAEAVRSIGEETVFACLRAERALAAALDATCNTPLGAHARLGADGDLELSAWVGLPDGSAWASDRLAGGLSDPEGLAGELAERLRAVGAQGMLARAEEMVAQTEGEASARG